jgi:hypothetical protein
VRTCVRSTAPTAKPARSKSPFGYMPGISAVSPPSRQQPPSMHPAATPARATIRPERARRSALQAREKAGRAGDAVDHGCGLLNVELAV